MGFLADESTVEECNAARRIRVVLQFAADPDPEPGIPGAPMLFGPAIWIKLPSETNQTPLALALIARQPLAELAIRCPDWPGAGGRFNAYRTLAMNGPPDTDLERNLLAQAFLAVHAVAVGGLAHSEYR